VLNAEEFTEEGTGVMTYHFVAAWLAMEDGVHDTKTVLRLTVDTVAEATAAE